MPGPPKEAFFLFPMAVGTHDAAQTMGFSLSHTYYNRIPHLISIPFREARNSSPRWSSHVVPFSSTRTDTHTPCVPHTPPLPLSLHTSHPSRELTNCRFCGRSERDQLRQPTKRLACTEHVNLTASLLFYRPDGVKKNKFFPSILVLIPDQNYLVTVVEKK